MRKFVGLVAAVLVACGGVESVTVPEGEAICLNGATCRAEIKQALCGWTEADLNGVMGAPDQITFPDATNPLWYVWEFNAAGVRCSIENGCVIAPGCVTMCSQN